MSTKKFNRQATALPVEERALVVDSLLRTLYAPDAEVDQAWVAGEQVFVKARARLGR